MRLSIIALGHVHAEDLAALTTRFEHIEQLVLDIPPRDALSTHRAEFNRAVDAATADWLLIVREREVVDDALAQEILDAATAGKARGFRIRSVPHYAGKPLRLIHDEGELRFFHRRNYLRYANKGAWDEIAIQGSVVRLGQALRSVTFGSVEEHERYLAERAAPHSMLRRVFIFAHSVLLIRVLDKHAWRYLWVEAKFDVPPTADVK
jgi:hypothetical protein